ncbi:glycosyltransferase [Methylotuvimicrobium buryatense]|uniref:Glycosyltransferase family 4 protein n=1 Tax=Methylotuvimicrobium buryatense TaxID=95641 RepID=A0A4P9UPT3_METBY|nr:glycosyltransferase [Methylotuvimicrobium buryatense]QCW81576.1 glycosyltransferase family 4 protein [Methylotuvimicrobium buryatense]
MHILIIPSWYPAHHNDINGVFFREQALALVNHGFKAGVIYPKLDPLKKWKKIFTGKYGIEQEIDLGLPTLRAYGLAWLPLIPGGKRWLWLRQGRALFDRYIEQYGTPDVIHVHSMLNAGILAFEIKRNYGIPYIVTEHASWYARDLLTPEQLKISSVVARDAYRRIAVSQTFCALLENRLSLENGDWQEIPNIVDARFLQRPLTVQKKTGDCFRFISIAILKENKKIDNLIMAFANAFRGVPLVTLDIGGDGPERESLEALAKHLGIGRRVRFLGALTRDQVADAIAASDVFVLSSRQETFGVVVIEALALGKPVIATRCGGPESIIRPKEGVLVANDNVAALAEAMQRLRSVFHDFSPGIIREGCRSRYSEQAVIERLSQVYHDALSKSSNSKIASQ